MTQGKTIWIATIAVSAVTAVFGVLGQDALTSAGAGLVFSLVNESLFAIALRFVSLKRLSTWPRVVAWAFPLSWLGKQGVLLAAAYALFKLTHLPVVPFALAVGAYQTVRLGVMLVRPERYAHLLIAEQRSHQTP